MHEAQTEEEVSVLDGGGGREGWVGRGGFGFGHGLEKKGGEGVRGGGKGWVVGLREGEVELDSKVTRRQESRPSSPRNEVFF